MDNSNNKNTRRIARNTLLLYVRMLLLMVISLYTSRIVLNSLGIDDYGIYNVVGGVVAMFSIVSGSLSASISRYITYELGKRSKESIHRVFCTSVNVQFILIGVVLFLMETIGVWFLNHKMIIPPQSIVAANWVFQFSIITFCFNLWSVPYNATIIAHEKMSAFAYISIFDAVAKLIIAFAITIIPKDRLIYYGLLVLIVSIIQRFLYTLYCRKNFEECKYEFYVDMSTTKEMFGFAGWNFIGASAVVLRDQGGNILLNLFFGPVVNAARGIAMSVNSAVYGFVSNFMVALNPQITKSYASDNHDYMFSLAFQGARLSFYILLILALPIIMTTPFLLHLWLGIVPEHASNFVRLVLIFTMSESLASPLITIMLATGNIRNYQILVGGIQLMNLPLCYLGLKLGLPPETVFVVAIFTSVLSEFARLIMLNKMVGLPIREFLDKVYFNVIAVALLSAIVPILVSMQYQNLDLISFVWICLISISCTVVTIYFVGCDKNDRLVIRTNAVNLYHKIFK